MGRHSRRGPVPKGDDAETSASTGTGRGLRRGRVAPGVAQGVPGPEGARASQGPQGPRDGWPDAGVGAGRWAAGPEGAPQGSPGGGPAAYGVPRLADGTPAHGVPRFPDGTPAHGMPRFGDGTPAHGVPRFPDGTPAHGVPRFPDGTPAHGTPRARGGHPEQREAGGGWGELRGAGVAAPSAEPGVGVPRQRPAPGGGRGPRQDYVDAFGDVDVFEPRTAADAYASVTDWSADGSGIGGGTDPYDAPPTGEPAPAKGSRGRTFTGIAAAAVTTVLAVVVAGQVTDRGDDTDVQSQSAGDRAREARDSASRSDGRPTPAGEPSAAAPLTYEQRMDRKYPLSPTLDGSGKFDAIQGIDKAPGKGQKFTYRVDVEQGLGLDGELFAQAVQKTLNDDRSWAHNGARTFERIHSGTPDFVITLASPGTTADWCAKSGLDTTVDNVSCDSAATERVMVNAYRWAQGSETYGDRIHAYRQMLINHEVGHRLGYRHVTCDKDGDLAPVMQQQTKFLEHDGIRCRANPWAYPGN
ncbi:DUF3152 domain-containing protein [Streptomyces sp. CC219B]|uniref:DUF3152 domain-containing protein n=1 Tax=Streptomyces sp. CC219B TaxID=3044574 RepID=UPI0024A7B558|nr:DUF3152 domain-containing protein [Streptomyces sp. CC219B]